MFLPLSICFEYLLNSNIEGFGKSLDVSTNL